MSIDIIYSVFNLLMMILILAYLLRFHMRNVASFVKAINKLMSKIEDLHARVYMLEKNARDTQDDIDNKNIRQRQAIDKINAIDNKYHNYEELIGDVLGEYYKKKEDKKDC